MKPSFSHCRDSSFPAPVFAPAAAPSPVAAPPPTAAPPPAPPVVPGVMTVAQLVQPIRERDQRMDQQYDVLEPQQGYPTFTHFPAEDQEMWFRQFAQEFTWNPDHTNFIRDAFVHKVMDNYGKQIYE
ncbi:hypothetical protein YC2023_074852 [Brassica napus]